ncbi:hypothetical protein B566_EDAN001404 [Ephemera danica]|nr:hypothetical protein B566_EDAN001404 [Ephemera danica]
MVLRSSVRIRDQQQRAPHGSLLGPGFLARLFRQAGQLDLLGQVRPEIRPIPLVQQGQGNLLVHVRQAGPAGLVGPLSLAAQRGHLFQVLLLGPAGPVVHPIHRSLYLLFVQTGPAAQKNRRDPMNGNHRLKSGPKSPLCPSGPIGPCGPGGPGVPLTPHPSQAGQASRAGLEFRGRHLFQETQACPSCPVFNMKLLLFRVLLVLVAPGLLYRPWDQVDPPFLRKKNRMLRFRIQQSNTGDCIYCLWDLLTSQELATSEKSAAYAANAKDNSWHEGRSLRNIWVCSSRHSLQPVVFHELASSSAGTIPSRPLAMMHFVMTLPKII